MPDFVLAHTQQWIEHFTNQGHDVPPLAGTAQVTPYQVSTAVRKFGWVGQQSVIPAIRPFSSKSEKHTPG
jgi:hypothetical protein